MNGSLRPLKIREDSDPTGPYKAVASAVSWRGLTGKWGRRWVAQVLELDPAGLVWECPHGHTLKRDAKGCAQEWIDKSQRTIGPKRSMV